MATLEDVYPIVADLTAKLRMPQPQILVTPTKVLNVSTPAFLGQDGLRISPEILNRLSVDQLRITLAYALVTSKTSKRSGQIVAALSLAVILPLGTIYTLTTGEGASGLPSWFWAAAVVGIGLFFGANSIVFQWSTRQADLEVFRLTNDLPGIREYLQAGGHVQKGGSPVAAKPGSVEKRIANLQG